MFLFGSIIALVAAASPIGPASSMAIPFELSGGRIYVDATVNGRGPFRFALDTGASGMGRADTRLVDVLALTKIGATPNSDGVAVTSTDVVRPSSLELGPITRSSPELLSRDYNRSLKPGDKPLMGIVGRDFLAGWTVTIDYPARKISFSKAGLKKGAPAVVPFGPGLSIPVCFGSVCRPGKVDTGSNRALVLPEEMAVLVAAGEPTRLGQATRTNSSVSLYEVAVAQPARVGALTAPVSKILYAVPSTDTVNIGSEFLKDYVLTIDSSHGLLKIAAPASAKLRRSPPGR